MKRVSGLAAIIVSAAGVFGLVLAQDYSYRQMDEELYKQMVTIKGKVQIFNPDLGITLGNGIYLLFQRDDCKRCVIATTTDAQGNYQIRVGQGRYRVIAENQSPVLYDMLAPHQPRFINATEQDNQFDIKLVVPSSR